MHVGRGRSADHLHDLKTGARPRGLGRARMPHMRGLSRPGGSAPNVRPRMPAPAPGRAFAPTPASRRTGSPAPPPRNRPSALRRPRAFPRAGAGDLPSRATGRRRSGLGRACMWGMRHGHGLAETRRMCPMHACPGPREMHGAATAPPRPSLAVLSARDYRARVGKASRPGAHCRDVHVPIGSRHASSGNRLRRHAPRVSRSRIRASGPRGASVATDAPPRPR